MTFQDIYDDIVLRAGEGYDAYADRAKEAFWKAVSATIQKGDYTDTELRTLLQRYVIAVNKSHFGNNRFNIFRIWNDADPAAGRLISPFHTHEVFEYKVDITPIVPENMKYHQVPIAELYTTRPLDRLTQLMGIPELIYAFDYYDVYINPGCDDFQGLMTVSMRCILKTVMEDATSNSDNYFNYSFIVRAIELAVQILKTETE